MSTTAKGVPYPDPTDPNDVPAALEATAEWIDSNPGVAALTISARDDLTGGALWDGRTIYNTTTARLEFYTAADGWQPVSPRGTWAAWTPTWYASLIDSAPRPSTSLAHGGILHGRYMLTPDGLVHYRLLIRMSDTNGDAKTGAYRWSLPVPVLRDAPTEADTHDINVGWPAGTALLQYRNPASADADAIATAFATPYGLMVNAPNASGYATIGGTYNGTAFGPGSTIRVAGTYPAATA